MIGEKAAKLPIRAISWGVGCVLLAAGAYYLAVAAGVMGDEEIGEDSPVYVEEFRVAEPLGGDSAPDDRWDTITAVTEPYDEVEAAVDEEPEPRASDDEELARQCRTVLKEIAFCTGEDSFLDIIGTASNLQRGGQRERFMERVQQWFEPEGARSDCHRLLADRHREAEKVGRMWAKSSEATALVCDEFGDVLIEVEVLDSLGRFWQAR